MDPACLEHRLSAAERRTFEEQGYLIVEDALSPDVVARVDTVLDGFVATARRQGSSRIRRLRRKVVRRAISGLHLEDRVTRPADFAPGRGFFMGEPLWADEALTALLDWPTILPKVWGLLGWNIFVYSQAATVIPPGQPPEEGTLAHRSPHHAIKWHRDAGRVNGEVGPLAPRLAVKVGYFLSDLTEAGRGNLLVVPGSHCWTSNPLDQDEADEHGISVCAPAGSAVMFDRRLVHSQSVNTSTVTRKVVFYAYAYRWMSSMGRQPPPMRPWYGDDPVRHQLLGTGDPYGRYFPKDDDVPLRGWLLENDPDAVD